MEIVGAHPYFLSHGQRRKHGRVGLEEEKRVARSRRSMLRLRSDEYSPRLHEWIFLIVTLGQFLFNGYFVSRDEAEDFRERMERR